MTSESEHKVTLGMQVDGMFSHYAGFVTNRRLLLSGSGTCLPCMAASQGSLSSDAMGRVLYSWKDLQDLAGYTARVSELIDTMSDIRTANFKKSMIASASEEENARRKSH
jgi:ATP-binding cassette subfamily D (ALD) long-chain fatty acid import protein